MIELKEGLETNDRGWTKRQESIECLNCRETKLCIESSTFGEYGRFLLRQPNHLSACVDRSILWRKFSRLS